MNYNQAAKTDDSSTVKYRIKDTDMLITIHKIPKDTALTTIGTAVIDCFP